MQNRTLAHFEAACERADCPAARCVMIGDRLDNDIAPAKSWGLRPFGSGRIERYTSPTSHGEQADTVVDRDGTGLRLCLEYKKVDASIASTFCFFVCLVT